jgi:hypothetical protein
MAAYYIDQTLPGGTVLPNGGTTSQTIPALNDGDTIGFPKGKRFLDPVIGTLNAGTLDLNTKTVVAYCYDPATGLEWTGQFDPYQRYLSGQGWPSEAEILANYAIIDKGVNYDSPGNDTPLNNRSVVKGVGKGSVVRGLCVQGAWYAGIESTNITNGDYLIDKCIVRKIGTSSITVSGVSTWGVGIRHNFASAGKMRVYRTFIEGVAEDDIWGAQTLGTQDPEVWRVWARKTVAYGTAHIDNIQFQNPNNYHIWECILDHRIPEGLDSNGNSRVGNDIILAGSGTSTGGVIEDCVVVTNSEATNLGTSTGGCMQRCVYVFISNRSTVAKNGIDDGGIGFVNPGSGHLFQNNLFIMATGRQTGGNGFMFGETDWLAGTTLRNNTFVGSRNVTKNACFDTRTTTTGVAQNNLFVDFENAIVNTTNPLATETNNAFVNCTRKRSTSKSGGTDAGVNVTSFATTAAAAGLGPDYRLISAASSLVGAGTPLLNALDCDRKTWWNPPTIGAFEAMRDRVARG